MSDRVESEDFQPQRLKQALMAVPLPPADSADLPKAPNDWPAWLFETGRTRPEDVESVFGFPAGMEGGSDTVNLMYSMGASGGTVRFSFIDGLLAAVSEPKRKGDSAPPDHRNGGPIVSCGGRL